MRILLTIMFCVIIGVIVGGRLGYVLFYGLRVLFPASRADPRVQQRRYELPRRAYRRAFGGSIAAAKLTRIPYLTLADLGCIGAPLGLLFGRCANFINGELWGAPTDAAWALVFRRRGHDAAPSVAARRSRGSRQVLQWC